jgi:hypothetical protein
MPDQAHATDIRMVLCPRCGAPVTSPATGGQFQCPFCQAVGTVAARDDRPAGGGSPLSPDQEKARVQRLWLQAQQGNEADPYDLNIVVTDVAHILKTPPTEFRKVWTEAWNRATSTVQADPSPMNQRRVFWLAEVLNTTVNPERARGDEEWMHRRAVIETALDMLQDPGHRQILRGTLFGRALRSGDIAAAERWLAGCDPAPAYLSLDSDYRTSLAMLEIANGRWERVLAAVGERSDEVPFVRASACSAALYRAHALEELGRSEQALGEYMRAAKLAEPHLDVMLKNGEWCRLCQKLRARAPAIAVPPAAPPPAPPAYGASPVEAAPLPAAPPAYGAPVALPPPAAAAPRFDDPVENRSARKSRALPIILALVSVLVVGVVVVVLALGGRGASSRAGHATPHGHGAR